MSIKFKKPSTNISTPIIDRDILEPAMEAPLVLRIEPDNPLVSSRAVTSGITLRKIKNAPLTNDEMDGNFEYLDASLATLTTTVTTINDTVTNFPEATDTSSGVVRIDNKTIKTNDAKQIYVNVDELLPIFPTATVFTKGLVKIDDKTIGVNTAGQLFVKGGVPGTGGGAAYIDGNGIFIDSANNSINVKIGSGLAFDSTTNSIVTTGTGNKLKAGTGIVLTTDSVTGETTINATSVQIEGLTPITGYLTDSTTQVPTSYSGTGYALSTLSGKIVAFDGAVDVTTITSGSTTYAFTIENGSNGSTSNIHTKTQNGLTVNLDKVTGVYTLVGNNSAGVETWTTDSETFTIVATVTRVATQTVVRLPLTYKVVKVKAGSLGTPAPYITVTGEQSFHYTTGSTTPTTTNVKLVARLQNLNLYKWQYESSADVWVNLDSGDSGSMDTHQVFYLRYDHSAWGTKTVLHVRCLGYNTGDVLTNPLIAYDDITIAKIYDGAKGDKGDPGTPGLPGASVNIIPNRAAAFTSTNGVLDSYQTNIVYTAYTKGFINPQYTWTFTRTDGTGTTPTASSTNTYTVTSANFGTSESAMVKCEVNEFNSIDKFSASAPIVNIHKNSSTTNVTAYTSNQPPGPNDGNYGDSWFDQSTQILWFKYPPDTSTGLGGGWKTLLINTTNVTQYIPNAAIGSAQIGSVKAGVIETGSLRADRYVSVVDEATPANERVRMGKLAKKLLNNVEVDQTIDYGIQGWVPGGTGTTTGKTEVFRLDSRGLDAKITQSALQLFGSTYRQKILTQGSYKFEHTSGKLTTIIPFNLATTGMYTVIVFVNGYFFSGDGVISEACYKWSINGVYYNEKDTINSMRDMNDSTIKSDYSTSLSTVPTDGSNLTAGDIQIVRLSLPDANGVKTKIADTSTTKNIGDLGLELGSRTHPASRATPGKNTTTFTYIVWIIDNDARQTTIRY